MALTKWFGLLAVLLCVSGGVVLAQETETAEPPETQNLIAYTLRDEFFNDYGIALVTADGTPAGEIPLDETEPEHYVTRCDAPLQWSPDGTQLAFVRSLDFREAERRGEPAGVNELVVADVVTGDLKILPISLLRTFDWSPDGRLIVHDMPIDDPIRSQPESPEGLYAANVETGEDEPLIAPESGHPLWQPRWSPDGSRIGFHEVQGQEGLGRFAVANADGTGYTPWNEPVVGSFDWSPDGSRIVFDTVLYLPVESQLMIAEVDASNQPRNVTVLASGNAPNRPQWSPDGQRIAFLTTNAETLESQLWVMALDGGEPLQLLSDHVISFDWSPDSTQLIAATNDGKMMLVDVQGGQAREIAEGGCPAWQLAQ